VTHEELLQAINDKLAYYTNNNFGASGFAIALCSVVKLHKDENGWCLVCNYPHPCSTIKAIEKELV
jgi:hypothetical protein